MKNLKKVAKMSRLAFSNAIRLHKDSILLFKKESFPSAYLLSILAQEEIGKAYILEDLIFKMQGRKGEIDSYYEKIILKALTNHKLKQGSFSRQADDAWKYGGKRYPKSVREMSSGKLEEKKQDSAYVGLTRKYGKINAKGKILNPSEKINSKEAQYQITRANDFIIELIEGCRRGVYTVETDELDSILTIRLAQELSKLWPNKTKSTVNILKKIRRIPLE